MKIHVWVPEYAFSTGGIQTLSRFLVRALHDQLPDAKLRIVAKNDTSVPDLGRIDIADFSSVGCWVPSQRTLAFTFELFRRALRERPDLIIVTHVNFAPVASWLKKISGIPFIALGNGIEVWEIPSRSIRHALRNADGLVAISEFTRQRMATALNISPDAILKLPCTFSPENFRPSAKPHFLLKRYDLSNDQPVILTIARLASAERYKGYDQVLRALLIVRKQFPDVRYILGGRGSDRRRVMKLIEELGLLENVILVGHIPEHELCAHYNLCDVFAMPSKGEGFGIVFLEAMACGKPVIAGNKDGSVDPVLDGKLGVLVDPDDIDHIGEAILGILERQIESEAQSLGTGRRGTATGVSIPEIVFDPDALRREVIAMYGYGRFLERVADIVRRFVQDISTWPAATLHN